MNKDVKKFSFKNAGKALIAFIPTIWFPLIINQLGIFFKLSNSSKNLTAYGWFFTFTLFAFVLYRLYNSMSKEDVGAINEEKEQLEGINAVNDKIICGLESVSYHKYEKYMDYVNNDQFSCDTFLSSINQDEILKSILLAIKNIFCLMMKDTKINERNIVVTLAYNINGDWHWVGRRDGNEGLTPDELTNNPYSTFHNAINGKSTLIFFPSKQDANEKMQYIFDKQDEDNMNIGSIICKKIQWGNKYKDKYYDAVLTISTYGKQLIRKDNINYNEVRETISNILAPFEKRIIEELAFLFIKRNIK